MARSSHTHLIHESFAYFTEQHLIKKKMKLLFTYVAMLSSIRCSVSLDIANSLPVDLRMRGRWCPSASLQEATVRQTIANAAIKKRKISDYIVRSWLHLYENHICVLFMLPM